ncbi:MULTISPECIES: hypothetical protein [unclassified Streptomyces]|uniref:hypothetical protein n=1 Tax=unclassified Streptomyces TaxID=2593676 RepID=UPI0036DFF7C9
MAIDATGRFSAVGNPLTARESLTLVVVPLPLHRREGRRRTDGFLRHSALTGAAAEPVVTFSGGMRSGLGLVMTLAGDPCVIRDVRI